MGEQALKEELIRKKIIQADQDLKYKQQQTALSETRRKKMEAELIETTWVLKTLGHGMAIYRKETESAIATLLKTVIAEQGIAGEDKEKYYKMLTDMLEKSFKKHGAALRKKVNTYSPAKILEGGEE
jgi:hypothetical protein